jgi:predicted DNA-binding protein (MmcQ/YjbR family)
MAEHPARRELLKYALSYPAAHEDHPWGETVVKVNKKIFVFFGSDEYNAGALRIITKLTESHLEAIAMDFTELTGYNLGKHGWVTANIPPENDAPVDLLREWIDESYRTVAPKRLSKQLDPGKPLQEERP